MSCQCRDFPQSYVAISLALATRNFFHNFLSFRSLFPFKILSSYRLLHEYGYLRYFRDLRNGIVITIPNVSKECRYPYSCNNLFRLWLKVALSLWVTITISDFLIESVCVCSAKITHQKAS